MDFDSITKYGYKIGLSNIAEILATGGFGASSETLFLALFAKKLITNINVPYDASDFGRCLNMVNHLYVTKEDLIEAYKYFPELKYIEKWDELKKSYENEDFENVSKLLNS